MKNRKKKSELDIEQAVSSTECTGLIPTPPVNEDELEAYDEIFPTPKQKEKS